MLTSPRYFCDKKPAKKQLNKSSALLCLLIILIPITSQRSSVPVFIVWNVGQGSWATYMEGLHCIHLDVGGEYANWKKIRRTCRNKNNLIIFTHGDWDHIGLAKQLLRHVSRACVALFPRHKLSAKKNRFLKSLPRCGSRQFRSVYRLAYTPRKKTKANSWSTPLVIQKMILLTGDTSSEDEKIWSRVHQRQLRQVRWFVASHHGSKNSNSYQLLRRLTNLQLVIVSARRARYGHPHRNTLRRIQKQNVAALTTERWGNIYIPLPFDPSQWPRPTQ